MESRRRIDQVLDPSFVEELENVEFDELRRRRTLSAEIENELSYHRRMLHGRMDLIRFELRRRCGEEERSLIDALPEILADDTESRSVGPQSMRYVETFPPIYESLGRREIDTVLGDDVLLRLGEIDDEALEGALEGIKELEAEISNRRHRVHEVEDALSRELAHRYRKV